MNTIIPKPDLDIQPAQVDFMNFSFVLKEFLFNTFQGEDTILDRWEGMQFTDTFQLHNRSPTYRHGREETTPFEISCFSFRNQSSHASIHQQFFHSSIC